MDNQEQTPKDLPLRTVHKGQRPPEGSYGAARYDLAVAVEEMKEAFYEAFPFPRWVVDALFRAINFFQRITGGGISVKGGVTGLSEEEEAELRDIAIRLGAAVGVHPDNIFDRLVAAIAGQEQTEAQWDSMREVVERVLGGKPLP